MISVDETIWKKETLDQITTKGITYGKIKIFSQLLKRPITQKEITQYLNFRPEKDQNVGELYIFGLQHEGEIVCYCTLASLWPYSPFKTQNLYMSHLGYDPLIKSNLHLYLSHFFTELTKYSRNWKHILTTAHTEETSKTLSGAGFKFIEKHITLQINKDNFPTSDSVRPNKTVHIQTFQLADLAKMREVETECFPTLYHWSSKAILSMTSSKYYALFVAREKKSNRVIGYAWNVWYPKSQAGWLIAIATLPAYQNQGVGKALILKSFEWYSQKGVKTVALETELFPSNSALHFYRKLGFQQKNSTSYTYCLKISSYNKKGQIG
ncbi:MAG: GNAT family N-acetyltransferase [Promethearchaeota archaeon]